jgi:hypothetical protein
VTSEIDYQALLYGYAQYKREEKQATTDYLKRPFKMDADAASKSLKKHMEEEGLDEFSDGEHGVTGVLSHRGTGPFVADWENLPEESIVPAARRGWLTMNVGQFREWHRQNDAVWADMLEKHIRDGGQTSVLNIRWDNQ